MGFEQARNTLGGLDAGSYLQGGLSFLHQTFRLSSNDFIWQLWPPGTSIIEFLLVSIFGLHASPLLLLAVVKSGLLAITISLLWHETRNNFQEIVGAMLLAFLLFSSVTQGWLLDQGIMYAEGFYIFFLTVCLVTVHRFEKKERKKFLVFSAISFGIASYFRAVGFTSLEIVPLFCLFFVLIGTFPILKRNFSRRRNSFSNSAILLVFGTVAFIVTLPWTLFRMTWMNLTPLQWVITGDQAWKFVWQTDDQLSKSGWGITRGIDNWACHLDLAKCQKLLHAGETRYLAETINTISSHPIKFLEMRLGDFWSYWCLNGRWLYPPQNKIPAAFGITEGIIFLVLTILAMVILLKTFKKNAVSVSITLCAIFGSTLPLFIFHLESRYFIPIKVISVVTLILNLDELFKLFPKKLSKGKRPKNGRSASK